MEVTQFIISCAHSQLLSSLSRESQKMLHRIDSDTPFYVVFLDFWEPGYIPDKDVSHNIITCLDCTAEFWLGLSSGMK